MACIEAKFSALSEREQPDRQRWVAVNPDQRLGPDKVACGPEQRMPAIDGTHFDAFDAINCPPQERRVDVLGPAPVSPKTLRTHDQCERHRVDPEDQRPFLGYDVEKRFDAVSVEGGENSFVNRGNSARMAARKCDEILVRLFGSTKSLTQSRHRALFEWDHGRHRIGRYAVSG